MYIRILYIAHCECINTFIYVHIYVHDFNVEQFYAQISYVTEFDKTKLPHTSTFLAFFNIVTALLE